MFGDCSVYLFGSRIDDSAVGGDIDLLVETHQPLENRASMAARYTARLQRALGDQRIDVLLVDPTTCHQPIHERARERGVALWH